MGLAIVGFIVLFIVFVIVPGILMRNRNAMMIEAMWYTKKGKKPKKK